MDMAVLEIQELKKRGGKLYAFIKSNGISLGKHRRIFFLLRKVNVFTADTSPSIQKVMDSCEGAAKTLANQISRTMSKAYGSLHDETRDATKTGTTSNDLSQAMMPFLSDIERLRKLAESTVLAYDLVKELGNYS